MIYCDFCTHKSVCKFEEDYRGLRKELTNKIAPDSNVSNSMFSVEVTCSRYENARIRQPIHLDPFPLNTPVTTPSIGKDITTPDYPGYPIIMYSEEKPNES